MISQIPPIKTAIILKSKISIITQNFTFGLLESFDRKRNLPSSRDGSGILSLFLRKEKDLADSGMGLQIEHQF